ASRRRDGVARPGPLTCEGLTIAGQALGDKHPGLIEDAALRAGPEEPHVAAQLFGEVPRRPLLSQREQPEQRITGSGSSPHPLTILQVGVSLLLLLGVSTGKGLRWRS